MNTTIIEQSEGHEMAFDVFNKLASDRVIFISETITDQNAIDIVAALLYLDRQSDDKISIYLNVEQGDIRNIYSIYDTIKLLRSPIETFCIGYCFYGATLLLSSGADGSRFATKSSIITLGQVKHEEMYYTDIGGAKDIVDLSKKDNENLFKIFAKNTNQSISKIKKDCISKKFLTAEQAKAYGLIDKVIEWKK